MNSTILRRDGQQKESYSERPKYSGAMKCVRRKQQARELTVVEGSPVCGWVPPQWAFDVTVSEFPGRRIVRKGVGGAESRKEVISETTTVCEGRQGVSLSCLSVVLLTAYSPRCFTSSHFEPA